jgi:hypothetical protein
MTVGPTIEHPLPEGVSDTFTHSCECGATCTSWRRRAAA